MTGVVTREEGIERLRTLYAVLDGVPSVAVALRSWRSGVDGYGMPDERLLRDAQIYKCGSTACAVGWACSYPPFKELGLRIGGQRLNQPSFGATLVGWSAVEAFFSLTTAEARLLFLSSTDFGCHPSSQAYRENLQFIQRDECRRTMTDKQRVMRRIRRFLMLKGHISDARNAELATLEGVKP